jgi:integrase
MAEGVRKKGKFWTYYFNITREDGTTGKRERGGFKTQKEAKEARIKEMDMMNNGIVLIDGNMTFKEYSEEWMERYVLPPKRKINTYNRYKGLLNKYLIPNLGNYKLKNISPLMIEGMFDNLRKSHNVTETTLQAVYTLLHSILKRAVTTKLLRENACVSVERPKREKFTANVLDMDEIKMILEHLNTNKEADIVMKNAIMVSLEIGWRRGELAGFDVKNINYDENYIDITQNLVYSDGHLYMETPKGGESRRVYCSEQLMKILKDIDTQNKKNKLKYGEHYITNEFNGEDFRPLICWENGKYIHPNYFTTRFRKILKSLGIEKRVRWHDLRHTNATLQIENNTNFKVIQERLGHKDITTTLNLYSHVNKDLQKKSADALQNVLKF